MRNQWFSIAFVFICLSCTANAGELKEWTIEGDVSLDSGRVHSNSGGSLKIAPGARAIKSLRETDGSGRVTLWVFDDKTAPADPKVKRIGPCWGVRQSDGQVLIVGALYASYLGGEEGYSAAAGEKEFYNECQWISTKRESGWRKWDFLFDAEKGMSLLVDDKAVKFDWKKTSIAGFSGIVLIGDEAAGDKTQTLWVDDVKAALGGPMVAKPAPAAPAAHAAPPAQIVPEKDPAAEGTVAKLRDEVKSQHPRLLFGPDDLPRLRQNYKSDAFQPFREQLLSYLPSCQPPAEPKFLTDATDGQRQGLWRLPTVAYHYLMTGDAKSLETTISFLKFLEKLEHWETGAEIDSGMSSANIMIGAALAYDWVCDKLDPQFREMMRKKLVRMARAQYYGGHLLKAPGENKYWQNDPSNNHRWHRDAGMSLAILTAYEGSPDESWILTKTREELQMIADGLPADGTSHEGPTYITFGSLHLVLAITASDRCFGTTLLRNPYFQTTGPYWAQNLTPGLKQFFHYGDSGGAPGGGYAHFLDKLCALNKQIDVQAAFDEASRADKDPVVAWAALAFKDDELTKGGDYHRLSKTTIHPDIGLAIVREGWDVQNAGFMFRCGPLGGYNLNHFRAAHDNCYINVAHDDPDANSFVIYGQGELLAETDRYSAKKHSANHNTILVNGVGQMAVGRDEGYVYNQPSTDGSDMAKMAVITAWKDAGDIVLIEGEASGAYPAYAKAKPARPALDRFRRMAIWKKGDYILILDDIKAPKEVEITWLMQGAKLDAGETPGTFRLAKGAASCDFQLVSKPAFTSTFGDSSADDHGKALGWKQLHATVKGSTVQFASVYDVWKRGPIKITQSDNGGAIQVEVNGAGFHDTWSWTPATERFVPSTLHGEREGKGALAELGAKDVPPKP